MNNKALLSALATIATLIAIFAFLTGIFSVPQLLEGLATSGSGTSTPPTEQPTLSTPHSTITPVRKPPSPTATPTPKPPLPAAGTVLYRANWAGGLNGWHGAGEWKTVEGQLVSDGSAYDISLSGSGVIAPYHPVVADYAVIAQASVGDCLSSYGGTCEGTFGLMARVTSDNSGGYTAGVDYLHWSNFPPVTAIASGGALSYQGPGDPGSGDSFDPGAASHTYRFEVRGNHFALYIDGALMVSRTDNSWLDAGEVGLNSYNVNITVSSFEVIAL